MGMGGDQLIAAVGGQGVEDECGDAIRAAEKEEYGKLLAYRSPEAIRGAVASPGGATEAGLRALQVGGFEGAIAAADLIVVPARSAA